MKVSSPKILVLDDEHNYAKMLVDLLKNRGCQAEFCTSPVEALQQLRESQFALVVADFKMPEMDGAEFLGELRKFLPETPVIMISGFMNTPELLKVANIGVTLVLEKPFDANLFFDCVRRFVKPEAEGDSKPTKAHADFDNPVLAADTSGQEGNMPDHACLYGGSKTARTFLQGLHRVFKSGRHVWVVGPQGSEWELMATELVGWKGLLPLLPLRLCVYDLDCVELRMRLLAMAGADEQCFGNVVFVDYGCHTHDPGIASKIQEFFLWLEDHHDVLHDWHFVHGLPYDVLDQGFLDALPDAASSSWLMLRPLNERPLELAWYVRELLSERSLARNDFADDALPLLLGYSWPGNYLELRSVINRIALQKQRKNDAITGAELLQALDTALDDGLPGMSDSSLTTLLHLQQTRYLLNCKKSGQSMERLLKPVIDKGIIALAELESPENLPFLFSRLLVTSPVESVSGIQT